MDLELLVSFGIFYFMIYSAVFWLLVYFEKESKLRKDPKPKKYPLVTIMIPAYNEEETIAGTIESALSLDYPKKEIIVVNDGSTDKTREICEKYAKEGKIKLINQENSGKGAAMNRALKEAKGELILNLDADSYIDKDALKYMIGYFEDPKVAAVASTMKVKSRKNWLQKVQWAEYLVSIYLRKIMSLLNVLYVIPGPGGLYRVNVLRKLGGFDENSTAEDMEIAFRLNKAGYKIENSLNAIVYTECPSTLKSLVKQRVRWHHGFIYSLTKHKDMFMNNKYKVLGTYVLPVSVAWVGILLYTISIFFEKFSKSAYNNIVNFFLVGFDWNLFLKNLPNYFKVQMDVTSGFLLLFAILTIYLFYVSSKLSEEKLSKLTNLTSFILFFFTYTFLASLFWTSTLVFAFFNKNITWRGDSLEPLS